MLAFSGKDPNIPHVRVKKMKMMMMKKQMIRRR